MLVFFCLKIRSAVAKFADLKADVILDKDQSIPHFEICSESRGGGPGEGTPIVGQGREVLW